MIADPVRASVTNHPAKVYPVLVVVTVAEIVSPVLVVVLLTATPDLESKVTVSVLASHLAKRVKSEVLPWVYGKEITVADESPSSTQPRKLNPSLVGGVGALEIDAAVWVVIEDTEDPPPELNETVRVLASHFAWSVKLSVLPWGYGKEIAEPVRAELSNQPTKL